MSFHKYKGVNSRGPINFFY